MPEARDLVRHAFADVGGNAQPRALVGALRARAGRGGARRELLDLLPAARRARCCCCGPTRTASIRCAGAEEALDLLPDAQLRVLPGTGYLIAYDDPVGVARELAAFCG